jgi:hypothetical protein
VPILHTQLTGQGKTPDGKIFQVPPAMALQQRGPVVQVAVTLAEPMGAALTEQGNTTPQPVTGLVTRYRRIEYLYRRRRGAEMNLPVIGVGSMSSASHAKTPSNIYPIQIEVTGFPIRFQSPRTMGATLKEQGLLLLIGRDLLRHCTLFYNGGTGQITLSI